MRRTRHKNLYPHEAHGLKEVLKWKLFGNGHHSSNGAFKIDSVANTGARSGDRLTWIGHSSFALHISGKTILVDPVFSDYCAPLRLKRFRRTAPPGLALEHLAGCDAVLITHSHYDHLDRATILGLNPEMQYFVPAGLGRWFHKLGRRNAREFNWWSALDWNGMKLTCVPSQHFSSRTFWDRDTTLWCGWVLEAAGKTIYFVGDSGYCPVFQEIGTRFGPIDLAAIPIGAYEPRWFMKPMHVNPEEAVKIHQEVRAKRSVACHWGTFCLTDEPMAEPPNRLRAALQVAGLNESDFLVLKIGETVPFGCSIL